MGSEDDTLSMDTTERMGALATVKASVERLRGEGVDHTEFGAEHQAGLAEARAVIERWAAAPRKTAEKLLEHYGPPNELTPTKLFWYRNGPWRRTVITADEIVHNFPTPHTDYLSQYVDYPVDPRQVSQLVEFDGSVLVDRTAGEIGARCDHEAFNILTLNLVHEILTGKRTVEDARKLYAETAAAFVLGRDAPYAERLLFDPPGGDTGDADEATIADSIVHQMVEKAKDIAGSGEVPR